MLGEDVVNEAGEWAKDGRTPMSALLAWQGESGAFQADFGGGRQDDFFSTAQTLPALAYSQLLLGRLLQAPVVTQFTPESSGARFRMQHLDATLLVERMTEAFPISTFSHEQVWRQ